MFLPQPSPVTAAQHTNRLLAALEPEDFARLEPHLELVDLTRGRCSMRRRRHQPCLLSP